MNAPHRIQLSRKPGWEKPANTVVVARPSRWGNPFAIGDDHEGQPILTADQAVALFRAHRLPQLDVRALRGKHLACWCRLDQPCHAELLLQAANADDALSDVPCMPEAAALEAEPFIPLFLRAGYQPRTTYADYVPRTHP